MSATPDFDDVQVIAVDPGPKHCNYVLLGPRGATFGHGLKVPAREALALFAEVERASAHRPVHLAVEGVQSYAQVAGAPIFDTAKTIGALWGWQMWRARIEFTDDLTRPRVKAALAGRANATDGMVNAALYSLYGDGTVHSCKGTKGAPGPCHGFTADVWDALAVGVVALARLGAGPLYDRDHVELPPKSL